MLSLYLLMQVHAWMEYQLLIFGTWLLKSFTLLQPNRTTPKIKREETRHVTPHQTSTPKSKLKIQPSTNNRELSDVDNVSSNSNNFEDNEAVIKMIIEGLSPTIRHVSRTHRVALDRLFDRITLDTKIQIRYTDTKHQLADMLTKGNPTRDEWDNLLLHLFNTSHFSSICCA